MNLKSKLFYAYLVFVIVYCAFLLLPAPSPIIESQYHLTPTAVRIIYATIIVLSAVVWWVAFYGYSRIREYSSHISGTKDGRQVSKLATGVFMLALWLPVTAAASSVLNYFTLHHPGFAPTAEIINNYLSLLFPLAGFVYIGIGARGLSEIIKQRPTYRAVNILALTILYLGLTYARLVATTHGRNEVYHMNIWFILMTLVVPYIYMWFLGLLSVYEIYNYRRKITGIIYKQSWGLLALGFGWLIMISIGLQYLTTLSDRLADLSIYWILLIVYSLVALLSVGFILIAWGANKLAKIEKV